MAAVMVAMMGKKRAVRKVRQMVAYLVDKWVDEMGVESGLKWVEMKVEWMAVQMAAMWALTRVVNWAAKLVVQKV